MKNQFLYFFFIIVLLLLEVFLGSKLYYSLKQLKNQKLSDSQDQFVAYVRVKNEIKTIEACLNSIDGAFDRIVIIHSNEPDDGSVDFMNKWCTKKRACEIHEYPHAVIPNNDIRLKGNPKYENTLAAYYEFGLQFFKPEDWLVKIDADQVYIKEELKHTFNLIKRKTKRRDNYLFGILGYNTMPRKGVLMKYKSLPKNGLGFDQYIVKKKYIQGFTQEPYWEKIKIDTLTYHLFKNPHWFHFSKAFKKGYQSTPSDIFPLNKLQPLSKSEKNLYQQKILPVLIQSKSPYADLKY